MKTLLLISTLYFSTVMFLSPSYAGWTKVTKDVLGNTSYIDFDRIRKHDGYVFYWDLTDYLKPMNGDLSAKVYNQGDCKLFRLKYLSIVHHKQPMARGTGESNNPKNPAWEYPSPNSVGDIVLKAACSKLVSVTF